MRNNVIPEFFLSIIFMNIICFHEHTGISQPEPCGSKSYFFKKFPVGRKCYCKEMMLVVA